MELGPLMLVVGIGALVYAGIRINASLQRKKAAAAAEAAGGKETPVQKLK